MNEEKLAELLRELSKLAGVAILGCLGLIAAFVTFYFWPTEIQTVQRGYRGTGMEQVYNSRFLEGQVGINAVPEAIPAAPPGGKKASEVYQNVQVLRDVTEDEFTRLMVAITEWVSPDQGCAYCHAEGKEFSDDSLYTKIVSRRMLQMTKTINTDWRAHVAQTGVTCYTCHRGQPVPAEIWFNNPGPEAAQGMAGNRAGQNAPAPQAGLSSLPYDPFQPFFSETNNIRVISATALPSGNRQSIKQTEWTYGLMMHMSTSLGVNCTFCHNSRSFTDWDQSPPQRASAWHGIRMVQALNATYLDPLRDVYPEIRRGPLGDAPKTNCATCHRGAYKPLYGANMLKDYPELGPPPAQ